MNLVRSISITMLVAICIIIWQDVLLNYDVIAARGYVIPLLDYIIILFFVLSALYFDDTHEKELYMKRVNTMNNYPEHTDDAH